MEFKKIVVIGAGTMGNGIAHVFALNGFKTFLVDVNKDVLNKAVENISTNLDRQISKSEITKNQKDNALLNLNTIVGLENIDSDVDLIVEAINENKTLKMNIFSQLQKQINPETILATNTSSISVTELSSSCANAEKFIGMHFMNPVPKMKLVEIIRGYSTSQDTLNSIMDLSKRIKKIPVEVKDYPGFISNRILMPMINEAIFTLYEGIASAEDIDTIMKLGMNHPMGPLSLADFIGLDVCLAIMNVLYEGFNDSKYRACPLLKKMVAAGKLGRKTKEGFFYY